MPIDLEAIRQTAKMLQSSDWPEPVGNEPLTTCGEVGVMLAHLLAALEESQAELAALQAENARLRAAVKAAVAADDAFRAAWEIRPYGQEGGYNKARAHAFLAASRQAGEAEAQLRAALEGKP